MNPLIIVASLLVLISVVGLAKKNRELFLSGYFIYGLLVFGAETNEFISYDNTTSLFVAFLWLIQAVLALPVRAKYDSETVKKDRIKICVCYHYGTRPIIPSCWPNVRGCAARESTAP